MQVCACWSCGAGRPLFTDVSAPRLLKLQRRPLNTQTVRRCYGGSHPFWGGWRSRQGAELTRGYKTRLKQIHYAKKQEGSGKFPGLMSDPQREEMMTPGAAATLKRAHLRASCQDCTQVHPNIRTVINKELHSSLIFVKDLIHFI